ncbi:MAG TPA: type 2 lanthipeptide synthetase LanM family protein [Jatrophihabitans sp.]|nr:type 2 lanthipeptide synthetase LanM family protein [Jatrophihabitans sp.]
MDTDDQEFEPAFRCLTDPVLAQLSTGLDGLDALASEERRALLAGATEAVTEAVRRKVSRLLLLELNAARVTGGLAAADSAERWAEFVGRAGTLDFWRSMEEHYPTLLPRLAAVISGRADAAYELGRRFGNSRSQIADLVAEPDPHLRSVTFGAGDSHQRGRSVAVLELSERNVVYKPRPLGIDVALGAFLDRVFDGVPATERIRVPTVANCGTYGWSEFIQHRYCASPRELRTYYTRIGHWLALARLFGTTDLHAENVIAAGDTPVVIDCETVFTPLQAIKPYDAGDALDRAAAMLAGTVWSSGLLPSRGAALGWRGVDISAGGALPGQQPELRIPRIVGSGTDRARVELGTVAGSAALNLPGPQPDLHEYWPQVLAGFDELTERLRDRDAAGQLAPAMRLFEDVEIRAVLRATEAYAELGRMLWHPVSLHDEASAVERATALLSKQSEATPAAPSDPAVIAAEVAELLDGDIPYFYTTSDAGWLRGPRETSWGPPHDVVADALAHWRSAELTLEREVIRSSLVCAYINDGYLLGDQPMPVADRHRRDLAGRRLRLAASVVERLVESAVRGDDGTATWIAPVMNPTGWSVQPLNADGYSGAPGVALLLAGYQHEVEAGRALPVAGVPELLAATVRNVRMADDARLVRLQAPYRSRPDSPGLYVGLGSQIWCWSQLASLGAVDPAEADRRIDGLAGLLPAALAETADTDLLQGLAGGVLTLLRLADRTSDQRYVEHALSAGERLIELARVTEGRAWWPAPLWPNGIGGFGHGATGIGWALAQLGQRTGRADCSAMADAAFAFEESLWDPAEGGWRDAREESGIATAWCHGATGIGLASAALLRRGYAGTTDHASVVRRAAESCWHRGMGWNHTICHGDLGCWELLAAAGELGLAPAGVDRAEVEAYIVASIEQNDAASGLARSAFVPGLMPGLGGVAYQLLRMDPDCPLPSALIID